MASKTWFITGTSRGFGREWAKAALERGDRVAAATRDLSALDDLAAQHADALLPIVLDVTDREAAFAVVAHAHDRLGRLDVVVNNAGYGQFGMVEETTEQEARDQIETNLFGALWVTQAALPILRQQRSGHIIQVSSISGISAFPGASMYQMSKWGLEGLSQALAQEVEEFGIHVTLVEPGEFATDWSASTRYSEPLDVYAAMHRALSESRRRSAAGAGDPIASAQAIMKLVDADKPPLRCFFGRRSLGIAEADYAQRLNTWRAWQRIAELAQGDG